MRITRETCLARDAADPLAKFRGRFELPDGVVYLDGNSLGPLPRAVASRLDAVVAQEWGEGLIRSWNDAGWIDLPVRVGGKIAGLIGAAPEEVICCDSTSVNLFKLLSAALALRPGRSVILSEAGNFPTDNYVAEGLARFSNGAARLRCVAPEAVTDAIDEQTAVVSLTHVNYRTGAMYDMAAITAAAHASGALMLWDLSHSAGAVPVGLSTVGADMAVGCGYKYLDGGPGAPAWLFVAEALHENLAQPLTGWMGHRAPFSFSDSYAPAPGLTRMLTGTPPVLAMAALEAALDDVSEAGTARLREKSVGLGELFIELVEQRCGALGLSLASPRDSAVRGSQGSFRYEHGYPVMQALIARGIIGDFRGPDIMRFGFAPLYLRYVDIWDAVAGLTDVLTSEVWREPRFAGRATVT